MEPTSTPSAAPAAPIEPVAAPQPAQAPEPQAPAPQAPAPAPQPEAQPAPQPEAPVAPAAAPEYASLDEYMASLGYQQPEASEFQMPDLNGIDPNDPEGITNFFSSYAQSIRQAAIDDALNQFRSESRVAQAEQTNWNKAMDKYSDLRTNQQLRDSVQAVREFNFQRGIGMTPEQAADVIFAGRTGEYQRGIADNQVTTTIQDVQPNNGNSVQVIPENTATETLVNSLGTSGEEAALQAFLEQRLNQEQK